MSRHRRGHWRGGNRMASRDAPVARRNWWRHYTGKGPRALVKSYVSLDKEDPGRR
jgi:hypothetical protein